MKTLVEILGQDFIDRLAIDIEEGYLKLKACGTWSLSEKKWV